MFFIYLIGFKIGYFIGWGTGLSILFILGLIRLFVS